jgi:hypothetical protein
MKLAGCSSPSRSNKSISIPFWVSRKNEREGSSFSSPSPPLGGKGEEKKKQPSI